MGTSFPTLPSVRPKRLNMETTFALLKQEPEPLQAVKLEKNLKTRWRKCHVPTWGCARIALEIPSLESTSVRHFTGYMAFTMSTNKMTPIFPLKS